MAKVFILSSARPPFDPWKHGTALLLQHAAELDRFGVHTLTDDPAQADIILFAEMGECGMFAERVRAHPVYRQFPDKCFLFDSADTFVPVLPGIYASLPEKFYRPDSTRTGYYLYVVENAFIRHRPATGNESNLASFIGSSKTSALRADILAIDRPDFLTWDTADRSTRIQYHGQSDERAAFWAEYSDAMASAKFALCPRGVGAGSIRLFEAMKLGRACVIISDAWHPNDRVRWSEFSIRVAESDIPRLPEILLSHEHRAREMGHNARREWETWFSESVRFHWAVEDCLDIQKARQSHKWRHRFSLLRNMCAPSHLRLHWQSKKNLYGREGRLFW